MLPLPLSYVYTLIGLSLQGIAVSMICVPAFPELIEVVEKKEKRKNDPALCDLAAGYYNAGCAFGALISPNLSGILADNFGFRMKCEILAAIAMTAGFLFFFINVGFREFFNWGEDSNLESKYLEVPQKEDDEEVYDFDKEE